MISILMPMFNAAPFINECIDSILNQSFTDWELIIVNDFSTDSSVEFIQQYLKKESRIRLFNNTEKGIQPALRLALSNSSGELITRMDADDIMPSNKLLWMFDAWTHVGKGHIITGKVSYQASTELGDGYRKYAHWLNHLGNDRFKEIYKECVIPSSCWLIHRDDLQSCGAFDSTIYPEDYHLCFQFYQHRFKIVSLDQILHLWRDHPNRTSRNDPNYADNTFIDLKVAFFIRLEKWINKPLIVWGSGKKGKRIVKLLQQANIPFNWVCNNPRKIGHNIHDSIVQDVSSVQFNQALVIIGFYSNTSDKNEISITCKHADSVFYFA